ncbi:hypothetical protein FB451DRAFT_1373150, partial [Mycena latifolia]
MVLATSWHSVRHKVCNFSNGALTTTTPRGASRLHTDVFKDQRRPLKLWDMHIPETAWDYTARTSWPYSLSCGAMVGYTKASFPDSKLPEPWSCRWRSWGFAPYWHDSRSLWRNSAQQFLEDRIHIHIHKPLMFRSTREDNTSTVFVAECQHTHRGRGGYYFYDAATQEMYRFVQPWRSGHPAGQISGTVEEFMERADWNNMARVGSLADFGPGRVQKPDRVGPVLRLHDLHTSE